MPRRPVVLIIEDEPDLADRYAEWLGDDYDVRTTIDGEAALEAFDESVDVVLLDRQLPDAFGEGLLGRLRERDGEFAAAMITGVAPDYRVLRLDIDEFVTKPIERDDLRALVERLTDRGAVEAAVDEYLRLLAKKQRVESERSAEELESDPRYRSLTSELLTRRRQIESLLVRLAESGADLPTAGAGDDPRVGDGAPDSDAEDDSRGEAAGAIGSVKEPPIYRARPAEFYGLWLLAALTYGVGDVVSTLYAVIGVAGVNETNPVVRGLLDSFGIPGFLLLKILVFLVLISVSVQGARTDDPFSYYWPPVVMTLLGVGLTAWNLATIAGVG